MSPSSALARRGGVPLVRGFLEAPEVSLLRLPARHRLAIGILE
jgi:hypothetical protein